MLDHPCVKLASSVRRTSERKSEGRGFKSHVRLTLYFGSENLSATLSIIYEATEATEEATEMVVKYLHNKEGSRVGLGQSPKKLVLFLCR